MDASSRGFRWKDVIDKCWERRDRKWRFLGENDEELASGRISLIPNYPPDQWTENETIYLNGDAAYPGEELAIRCVRRVEPIEGTATPSSS